MPGDLNAVWRAIEDPQTELALDEQVVAAGRLRSTRGLGEVQCSLKVNEDGERRLRALEVVEESGPDRVLITVQTRMQAEAGMRTARMRSFAKTYAGVASAITTLYAGYVRPDR